MSFKLIDRKPAHPDSSHHRTRSAILDAVTAACCPFGSKPFDGMGMLMDLRPAVLALSRMAIVHLVIFVITKQNIFAVAYVKPYFCDHIVSDMP
ncbi:hypothetical protein [Burkholderia sp. AU16741]|uniref:hypothetical protein n=1 Tax=Burkholderia sp. AU16741 TaxID=2015347 RepID=UPI00117C02AF|nr:hypothetical protein [Burkholderia sp. AU16741]